VKKLENVREVKQVVNGQRTSDGDGVKLTRLIGYQSLDMLDPFILMDSFGSDKPLDYIGGFPSHPHRGFETVTYMLAGKMRHKDNVGNNGVIKEGGVQWMSAGRGVIHSEMPEQVNGLLSGIQLWVNLPKKDKLMEPKYQEFDKESVPVETNSKYSMSIIAGKTKNGTCGIIENNKIDPTYWDIKLEQNTVFKENIPFGHNCFIFVIEGEIEIGEYRNSLRKGQLAVLEDGSSVCVYSANHSRFIIVAGKPLNQPVARGGPFVMNTQEEIQQAFKDYRLGNF
jgi:redox-sensitive bicupin YhaK (pirin superfamily)